MTKDQIPLSKFIENDAPLQDVRLILVEDGKREVKQNLLARAELANSIYKTKVMKINFAISHKKASVVCQTRGILKAAQNIPLEVIYDFVTIDKIMVSFPKSTNATFLDFLLMVDVFELPSEPKFFVVIGMILEDSGFDIYTRVYEYDTLLLKQTRQSEFWIYPVIKAVKIIGSLVLWGASSTDLKIVVKLDRSIIYLDEHLNPKKVVLTSPFYFGYWDHFLRRDDGSIFVLRSQYAWKYSN